MFRTDATLDDRDAAILVERLAKLNARKGPQVGEFVRFSDGTVRRFSYHWRDDEGWDGGMQTSDEGSFHLGRCGVSFSGSLYSCLPTERMRATDETMMGRVWFFHHDHMTAHNGVDVQVPLRVWEYNGLPNS